MTQTLIFDPLLPLPVLIGFACIVAFGIAFAIWRGLPGRWLRGAAAIALLTAIAGPSMQQEDRAALSDIVLVVVDESASQRLSDRPWPDAFWQSSHCWCRA